MKQSDTQLPRVGFTEYGLPLIGKGTQGGRAAKHFHQLHYAGTGDMLREYAEGPYPDAKEIAAKMAGGQGLIDDDTMFRIFNQYYHDKFLPSGQPYFLMDGMPRTAEQADTLQGMIFVPALLYFNMDGLSEPEQKKILLERQAGRIEERKRLMKPVRLDDTPAALTDRIETYHRETPRILEFYRDIGAEVIPINAYRHPDAVQHDLFPHLDRLMKHYRLEEKHGMSGITAYLKSLQLQANRA